VLCELCGSTMIKFLVAIAAILLSVAPARALTSDCLAMAEGPATLGRFIAMASGAFELETESEPVLVISAATLPDKPKLIVLPGH
jgi:hypothetical protein